MCTFKIFENFSIKTFFRHIASWKFVTTADTSRAPQKKLMLFFQTVEMTGNQLKFEKVVSNKIVGFPDKDITITAPRMLVTSRQNDSLLVMSEKLCKLERVNNFQVIRSLGNFLNNRNLKKCSEVFWSFRKIRLVTEHPKNEKQCSKNSENRKMEIFRKFKKIWEFFSKTSEI